MPRVLPHWLRAVRDALASRPRRTIRRASARPRVEELEDRTTPTGIAPPSGLTDWWPTGDTSYDIAGTGSGTSTTTTVRGPRTIDAWVDPAAATSDALPVFAYSGLPTLNGSFSGEEELVITGTALGPGPNKLSISGGGIPNFTSTGTVTPNTWNNIALTYDGRTLQFFINGQLAGTSPQEVQSFVYGLSDTDLRTTVIGQNMLFTTGVNQFFSGQIADVALYNRPLAATEIQGIYQAGPGGMNQFFVQSSDRAAGETIYTPPTDFLVRLSQPYDPASVQAGALLVNGIAATSVTLTDAQTLTFHFTTSPVTTAGAHTMQLDGGSILSAGTGTGLADWNLGFSYAPAPATSNAPTVTDYSVPTSASVPDEIALGSDGKLWFTEYNAVSSPGGGTSGVIGRITPDGQITEFPTPYPYPRAIVAGPDGNLWFTENNIDSSGGPPSSFLGVMSPTGTVLAQYQLPPGTDAGLAFSPGPDGNLWVTQYYGTNVWEYSPTGQLLATYDVGALSGSGFGASDVTVGPDGTVWLDAALRSGVTTLGKISPQGTFTVYSFGDRGLFRGLVVGPDGNVWAGEPDRGMIAEISPSGTLLAEYADPTAGSGPYSLAAAPGGNIWFTDPTGSQIGFVTPQGQVSVFPTATSAAEPSAITNGPNGTLWFTEETANAIGEFIPGVPVPSVVLRDANGNPATSFAEGETVTFDATRTSDPNPDSTLTYQWDFDGDGWFDATGATASVTFTSYGVHPVRLTVTDSYGVSTTVVVDVVVNEVPPTAYFGYPTSSPEGTPISLYGEISDPNPAALQSDVSFTWSVTKNGAPFAQGTDQGFTFVPDDNGTYVVTLAVTDLDGTGSTSQTIGVYNVPPVAQFQRPAAQLPGDPDLTFGTGGQVLTPIGPSGGPALGGNAVAQQADGKLVAVGSYNTAPTVSAVAVRYLSDGALDPTFGVDGVVSLSLPGGFTAAAVAIQADGRIVVAGTTTSAAGDTDFAVFRLNAGGTLDTTFGPNGTGSVETDLGGGIFDPDDQATVVALEGDKILVGGLNGDGTDFDPGRFAVVRYTADGVPDPTFGPAGNGIVLLRPNGVPDGDFEYHTTGVTALAVRDGQIYLAGAIEADDDFDSTGTVFYAVARLDANGTPDDTFGGMVPQSPDSTYNDLTTPGWAFAAGDPYFYLVPLPQVSMAIQPDGQIVLAGAGQSAGYGIVPGGLALVAADGSTAALDVSEGAPLPDSITGLAAQADGSLLVSGVTFDPTTGAAVPTLTRLNPDLTPDLSFGANLDGRALLPADPSLAVSATGLFIQADGSAIVTGSAYDTTNGISILLDRFVTQNGPGHQLLEGQTIDLTATATDASPVDAQSLTYLWTVTRDGAAYDSASGAVYPFTPDDDGTYAVTLTVTDKDGGSSSTTGILDVANVTPAATVTGPSTAVAGQVLTYTLTATDPSSVDEAGPFTYTINWGDGTLDQTVTGPAQMQVTHAFADASTDTVGVTATDKDGGTGPVATAPPVLVEPETGTNLQQQFVPGGTITVQTTTAQDAHDVIAAANSLDPATTPAPTLVVDLGGQTIQDTLVNVPPQVTVQFVNGTFVGGSPALIVQSGTVIVRNSTFSNATDASTILVSGGSLVLRNDSLQESTGFTDAAIGVTGGTVDLGTTADPGGNVLNVNGTGEFVQKATANPVSAVGDTFEVNGTALTAASLSFTALTAGVATSIPGQPVTLTATVSPNTAGSTTPTGTIDFSDTTTGTDLGTVTLSGGAATLSTSVLAPGTNVIRASYSGDGNYLPSLGTVTKDVVQSIYVLNTSADGALSVAGKGTIDISGALVVDSRSKTALTETGTAQITAASVQVVGGAKVAAKATISPAPQIGTASVADPLAGLAAPSGGTFRGSVTLKKGSLTINPGVYSSITVSGTASLTLNPGIYTIEGGGLTVTGSASVTGTGVLLYTAGGDYCSAPGDRGSITLSGNGTFDLTAPTSGPDAGIAIFQARDNARAMTLSKNAVAGIVGTVYAPAAALTLSGDASLSAALVVDTLTLRSDSVADGLTAPSGAVGYTPDQIRTAYGINDLSLDGTGQTIAIVDAYDDPAIYQSVDAFDSQVGLTTSGASLFDQYGPASSFLTVLNQNGQTTSLPITDPSGPGTSNWEVEESLDVEWVHAIAPGAQIVLVEADSQSLSDLMCAVATAAEQPGVSVVSMSWGFAEGRDVSAQDEATYDPYFTTPAGHTGVTFVASTGDDGAAVPEYPSVSPNVVAVGGTSLTLNADNSYQSETGWGYNSSSLGTFVGSGGGISQYESEPVYQQGVQSTGSRTAPDVSFVADPGTGAWVADAYNLDPSNPWEVVGGTSLSAPAWAGLLALADQGRVAAGEAALGTAGAAETQTALYGLSQIDYNAVTTGNNGYSAGPGYNLVTGLGTPVTDLLIPDLVAYSGGPASSTPVAAIAATGLVLGAEAGSGGGSTDAAMPIFAARTDPGSANDPRVVASVAVVVPTGVAPPTGASTGPAAAVAGGMKLGVTVPAFANPNRAGAEMVGASASSGSRELPASGNDLFPAPSRETQYLLGSPAAEVGAEDPLSAIAPISVEFASTADRSSIPIRASGTSSAVAPDGSPEEWANRGNPFGLIGPDALSPDGTALIPTTVGVIAESFWPDVLAGIDVDV